MAKFTAPTPTFIPARWKGGAQTPRTIVIHGTVSPCAPGGARAVAKFFANHGVPTSAHYTVDPTTVIQSVGDHTVAYHCGHNQDSIGVELCDPQVGRDSRWQDANHEAMLERAADLVAQLCLAYNIPITRVTVGDLKAGRHGICGHVDMSLAFRQSTHTDPGTGFPWPHFLALVRAAAADRVHAATVTPPKPKPAPKTKPKPRPSVQLVIATANLFKDNTHKPDDVKLLDRQDAHIIGLNEAFRFAALLQELRNYQVIALGTGASLNNVILMRNDVNVTGSGTRSMCKKVGSSPERTATWVEYDLAGEKRAHVQTHSNAHIENGGRPRILPRVTQNVAHMANLTALIRELRAKGLEVTVGGDLNWAWTSKRFGWISSPQRVFTRLGMYVNWSNTKTAPQGGSLGRRRIDYLAHGKDDLRIVSQRFILGEHSDHRWPVVTYRNI